MLETLERDHNVRFESNECRMNLVTRSELRIHLMHKKFQFGEIVLHGLKLNELCTRLNEVSAKRIIKALIHR
ncbi:MAG: hypothetical protein CMQ29_15695 [Gammaproteobacteria bacterium]|nr:hypothetical protein [Gammaproteobacteria bacterium]